MPALAATTATEGSFVSGWLVKGLEAFGGCRVRSVMAFQTPCRGGLVLVGRDGYGAGWTRRGHGFEPLCPRESPMRSL